MRLLSQSNLISDILSCLVMTGDRSWSLSNFYRTIFCCYFLTVLHSSNGSGGECGDPLLSGEPPATNENTVNRGLCSPVLIGSQLLGEFIILQRPEWNIFSQTWLFTNLEKPTWRNSPTSFPIRFYSLLQSSSVLSESCLLLLLLL